MQRCTSDTLAASLDTSPSSLRVSQCFEPKRLPARRPAIGGEVRLGHLAEDIRLSEIYTLVTADKRFWATRDNIPD